MPISLSPGLYNVGPVPDRLDSMAVVLRILPLSSEA